MNKYDDKFWKLLDNIVMTHEIKIDRPKGTPHPKYSDYIYPVDYGFLAETMSSDGNGIDIWIGTSNNKIVNGIISSIDILKGDSEIKILYSCTLEEIKKIYEDHNRSENMKGIISLRNL